MLWLHSSLPPSPSKEEPAQLSSICLWQITNHTEEGKSLVPAREEESVTFTALRGCRPLCTYGDDCGDDSGECGDDCGECGDDCDECEDDCGEYEDDCRVCEDDWGSVSMTVVSMGVIGGVWGKLGEARMIGGVQG